jgi:hypothetical protein
LDERMKALDDRVDALDEKVKALAEKGRPVTNVQTIPPGAQSQDVIADAAQMKAESDGARQQLPDDARALVADPLQGDPAKLEKDTRERLAQSQRELEEKQRSRQRKMELIQKWRMSGAAASTPAQATSSVPSPAVETTSPTPP